MTGRDPTAREWIVLLEAANERGASTIDPVSFGQMVSSWATPAPTILYSPDRYALQVAVTAPNAASALASAMSRWTDALSRNGLPIWDLVRAEILTPEELENEIQAAECASDGTEAVPHAPPATGEDSEEAELLRRALHDCITGLPGREAFLDEIRRAMAPGLRAQGTRAVMVVHFDRPGTLDPGQGRSVPDDVLAEIAGWLTGAVRRGDVVGCVGPAQFALLVEGPSAKDPDTVAQRIHDHVRSSLLQRGQPLPLMASVGVAPITGGADADQVLRMAEMAVMAARKPDGGGHSDGAAKAGVRPCT